MVAESAAPRSLTGRTPRAPAVDLSIVAVLGLAAFVLAKLYLPAYRAAGVAPPFYYQNQFGPAVMLACGKGFSNPDLTASPELGAFLEERVDHFRCEELPASIRFQPLNAFQGFSRYLMTAVAAVWWAAGIKWQSIDLLTAGFFGVSIAAAYAALRFVSGRALSLFFTLLWATSTWHLRNLPHLRDYSKVPFFVLTLLAVAAVFVEHRPSRLIPLGLAFGLVQGLGYGMRADVGLNFVPFLVVLFAGTPESPLSNLAAKAACAGAAIAAFAMLAYPIMTSYEESGALWHVVLLGLTSPYDVNLKLKLPLPPYNFGYLYRDAYTETVVASYWSRLHPASGPIVLGMRVYGAACHAYYNTVATTFPGDMATRMASAAVHVFNIPFSLVYGHVPLGISSPALVWLSERRSSLMEIFENAGPLAIGGVLVLIGMERLRYACIAFLLLLASAAYPSLQYQYRHVFQLELLVFAAIACGCSVAWRLFRDMRGHGSAREMAERGLKSIATVGALFVAGVAALVVARAVQVPRARALLFSYTTAPVESVRSQLLPLADGRVRVAADLFSAEGSGAPPAGDSIQTAMLVAEFAPDRCGSQSIEATFRYEDRDPVRWTGFSWQTVVPATTGLSGSTRVFLPVYSLRRDSVNVSRFAGVEVPAGSASCVQLFRVRELTQLPPLLLPATLGGDWTADRLYQRLSFDRAVPPRVWRGIVRWWPRAAQFG